MRKPFSKRNKKRMRRFLEEEPLKVPFIVEGLFPTSVVALLVGKGGCGKSFLALTLAICIAAGLKFLDKFEVKKASKVLYISCEESEIQIHHRINNILAHCLKDFDEKEKARIKELIVKNLDIEFTLSEPDFCLYPDNEKQNVNRIINYCLYKGNGEARIPPKFIIADNLTTLMTADHNKSETATEFMKALREIQNATDATVLLLAHTNKSSQQDNNLSRQLDASSILGSTSYTNCARLVLSMTKLRNDGEKQKAVLQVSKSNYTATSDEKIYLNALPSGVLVYDKTQTNHQNQTLPLIVEIVANESNCNKTQLVAKIQSELKVSRNSATRYLENCAEKEYIALQAQKQHNKKSYAVTEKGNSYIQKYKKSI